MAQMLKSESFVNAIIDTKDMTITEYGEEFVRSYSLTEFLKRWDGVVGITLSIHRIVPIPPDGRDE